jgi:lipoate-protein ligase A
MDPMLFLDVTLPTLAENLALDEALLLEAEIDPRREVLRVWEWPSWAVVLGAGGQLTKDILETACLQDQVPILRRASGGGTVLLGRGCLLYSLVLAYERSPALRDISASYSYILQRMADGLSNGCRDIEWSGTSDLSMAGRKFSGNSQQRKRYHLLQHGTLLYDFDIKQVAQYLHLPARQPAYRHGRPHVSFLTNLPVSATDLTQRLRAIWDCRTDLIDWPRKRMEELVQSKYTDPAWIRRR